VAKPRELVAGDGQGLEALLHSVVCGFKHDICLPIKSFPASQNAAEIAHGLPAVCNRAAVAWREDTGHVFLRFSAKPDGKGSVWLPHRDLLDIAALTRYELLHQRAIF